MKFLRESYRSLKNKFQNIKHYPQNIKYIKNLIVIILLIYAGITFNSVIFGSPEVDVKAQPSNKIEKVNTEEKTSDEIEYNYTEKVIDGIKVVKTDRMKAIRIEGLHTSKYRLETWLVYYKDFGITCISESLSTGVASRCWAEEETPLSIKNKLDKY